MGKNGRVRETHLPTAIDLKPAVRPGSLNSSFGWWSSAGLAHSGARQRVLPADAAVLLLSRGGSAAPGAAPGTAPWGASAAEEVAAADTAA